MEPWVLDAIKVTCAVVGILIFSFGFLFTLVFVPWKRCHKACQRSVPNDSSTVESQRVPAPYYTLISELLSISPVNSPTLPTYEQCTRQTLPPSFEDTIASDLEETAPPYTPPETTSNATEDLPPALSNGQTEGQSESGQSDANPPSSDMCLHCSLPDTSPDRCPPPYTGRNISL